MLKSLQAIAKLKNQDCSILKREKWLKYLALAAEIHVNLERIQSLDELGNNCILNYVERSLCVLDRLVMPKWEKSILEEVLQWAEVAKGGMSHQRKSWLDNGCNLFVHNLGSAQIYTYETNEKDPIKSRLIATLIGTHGLIGQYIRGEVSLIQNAPIYELVVAGVIDRQTLQRLLYHLNHCIIAAVSTDLWSTIRQAVERIIGSIIDNEFEQELTLQDRIGRLRYSSIKNGEYFEREFKKIAKSQRLRQCLEELFTKTDLWYVEAALHDFSFDEFIKIFLMVYVDVDLAKVKHISFELMMQGLYYQYNGDKRINIYKKRIIEKYLSELSFDQIVNKTQHSNAHLQHQVEIDNQLDDTAFFNFNFSPAAEKLIDFCIEAEKADILYEKAIILLFDLFGLRRDKYDRFHEEQKYLAAMNSAVDYKKVILEFITGENIMDIGPGGGVMLDLIEKAYPEKQITGLDISQNVIESLQKRKRVEDHSWNVIAGDALNLPKHVSPGGVDTIIFCSIIHELFSYIEFQGKRFNSATIAAVLRSALQVLAPGGRIIIRDGVMTEPLNQKRIIRFLSEDGLNLLERYAKDFQGRRITYQVIGRNQVLIPVNDAMEFLYTYTWGEKSYVHEVNEQFGYFTPSEFSAFIQDTLGDRASIIENRHFLQEGYTIALAPKVEFSDENGQCTPLPDSTCLIVIQKNK